MNLAAARADTRGFVAVLNVDGSACEPHEIAALDVAAQRIATLFGMAHAAEVDSPEFGYYIPSATLLRPQADALRITSEFQLWGGVIPHPFVGTKLVSHPLFGSAPTAPEGWKNIDNIQFWTLPGHAVFAREDARGAGIELLAQHGAIRAKPAHARGGNDQTVLRDTNALGSWLEGMDADTFRSGVVIEQHLDDAVTYSIGSSNLRGRRIAYWGVQRLVRNPDGHQVYGGSRLHVRRGGFEDLEAALPLGELSRAVALVLEYDHAVCSAYDILASRRNYDVIAGSDRDGQRRLGVLEQSWRFGGASLAELLAVERFEASPELDAVVAETVETYDDESVPEDALIHWPGDRRSPRKFARIVSHGH